MIMNLGHECRIINYIPKCETGVRMAITQLEQKTKWKRNPIKKAIYLMVAEPETLLMDRKFLAMRKKYLLMDLTYENMFASCNGEATIILDDEHCGHRKNNWFRDDMLSPTDAEVEKVFKYSANGKISAVRNRPSSNVAQDMIHNLGLDSFHLERDRKQAIQASEVFDDEDYTDDEIRSFIEYYSNKNNGEYEPYCKAIVDCLEEML